MQDSSVSLTAQDVGVTKIKQYRAVDIHFRGAAAPRTIIPWLRFIWGADVWVNDVPLLKMFLVISTVIAKLI